MTINTTATVVDYTGDGSSTAFAVTFPFFGASELEVVERTIATGAETVKTLTTHYTVSGGNGSTGTVNAVAAPASTVKWFIRRKTARTQGVDYTPNDPFAADTHERALDRAMAVAQELGEEAGRALKFPRTDGAALSATLPASVARAGRVLAFDEAGNPVVSTQSLSVLEAQPASAAASALAAAAAQTGAEAAEVGAIAAKDAAELAQAAAEAAAAEAGGGAIETITAGESLADRDIIYQDYDNERGGGAGRWYKVDTDATSPVRFSKRIGIALAAITSGNTGSAQVRSGRVSGFTGLTAGGAVWASTTAGATTQTAPAVPASGTQNATIVVGIAASTTAIDFDPPVDITVVARNSALTVGSTIVVNHPVDAGAKERVPRAYLAAVATAQTAVAGATGTAGGNMVNGGGVNAAFDGTTAKASSASALINSGDRTIGRVGKVWPTAKTISGIVATAPNSGQGFNQVGGSTITFTLYGGASTVGTSGTSLGSGTIADASAAVFTKLSGFTTTNPYICHWTDQTSDSGSTSTENKAIAQLVFYEELTLYEEPVDVASERISSGATDRVTCRFTDASAANGNTNTTFWNRTNATRDLIVEVTL